MNPNKIKEELERLLELVGGWASGDGIPSIERDLALDKLKSLYEAVRFAGTQERPAAPAAEPETCSEAASAPEEEPLVEVLDLEDVVSAGEHLPAQSAADRAQPAADRAQSATEDVQPATEKAEAAPEHDREKTEPVAEKEEPTAEKMEKAAEKSVSVTEKSELVAGKAEPAAEKANPVAEPDQEKEEAPCLQNSLFDMSEIPVHRRDSRRVLMSLYGDAPVRKPLAGLHLKHVPAAAPKPEAGARPKEAAELKHEQAPVPAPVPVSAYAPASEHAPAVGEETVFTEEPRLEEGSKEPAVKESNVQESAVQEPAVPEPVCDKQKEPENEAVEADSPEEPEEPEEPGDEADEEAVFTEEPVVTELPEKSSLKEPRPVLGEVFHSDHRTLGETLVPQAGAAPTLGAAAIASLREAIGINDRFLLIGDLFGGDRERYEEAIERLDALASLDDCMIHIAENYTWNPNSDGAKLLFELLERKYGEC